MSIARTDRPLMSATDAAKARGRGDVVRPPGPPGLVTTARLAAQREPVHLFWERIATEYPGIAFVRMVGEHVYVLTDPDLVVEAYAENGRNMMKGRALQQAKQLLGEGLLTSEGEHHLRQRRLVAPAFHRERIAAYGETFVAEAARHAADWRDGQQVDAVAEMSALTLAIVGRTLFGVDLRGDADVVAHALTEVFDGFQGGLVPGRQVLMRLPLPSTRRAMTAMERLEAMVGRIIAEHRAAAAAGEDDGSLMAMLVRASEDGVGMTDSQVRDEVMTLVLAGHETTAMLLSWAWWLLAQEPAALQRLQSEVDTLDHEPTMSDYADLHVTRATIAETLRLRPPAWMLGRRTLTDLRIGAYDIPAGSILVVSPWVMHRQPQSWGDDAGRFSPSRWLRPDGTYDEANPGQPRGAWFPFGWGNRRCIGDQFAWTEAVLVLATLVRRWVVEPEPGVEVFPRAAVTLRPVTAAGSGYPAVLRAR